MANRGRPKKEPVRRRKNLVIGRGRLKLSTPEIPGHETRWVNDDGMRIQDLHEQNDWEFVYKNEISNQVGEDDGNADLGARVSRVVGTKANGEPLTAYLMKIKKEFYEQDQREKESARREVEAQIKRTEFEQPIENKYGEISLGRKSA